MYCFYLAKQYIYRTLRSLQSEKQLGSMVEGYHFQIRKKPAERKWRFASHLTSLLKIMKKSASLPLYIFVHELGHLIVMLSAGATIEDFSIFTAHVTAMVPLGSMLA